MKRRRGLFERSTKPSQCFPGRFIRRHAARDEIVDALGEKCVQLLIGIRIDLCPGSEREPEKPPDAITQRTAWHWPNQSARAMSTTFMASN
jgi:hypothetical protein